MAIQIKEEVFENAIVDCDCMTITECSNDKVMVYSIEDVLKRWDGIPNIKIAIKQSDVVPPVKEGRW